MIYIALSMGIGELPPSRRVTRVSVMGGGSSPVLAAPKSLHQRSWLPHRSSRSVWLVPKSPVAFHSLGLLPVCIPF